MLKRRFRKMRARFLTGLLSVGIATTLTSPTLANPSGATVRNGQVQISGGVHTQIQQLTDRAIVDWQSFSIANGESVQFLQPSQLAVILNRVTGGDPSEILGQLSANGNVFLINPNGILFGPTATVNVGGLVASTLNITDGDFLSGNYSFFQEEGRDLAAVVNQGQIQITDAGYAVLVAPTVINEGTIIARAGNLVLASGEQATLDLDGRDLVHFALNGEVSEGTVLLAPGMMSETIAQTLGVESARRADKFEQLADGSVRMVSSSGTLVQAGTVSADGRDGLDAGSVLLDSADYTLLTAGSVTSASGKGTGSDGGEVLVLSEMDGPTRGLTSFSEGALVAASAGDTGDAGFVEISGNQVHLRGDVDLSYTDGKGGSFLLDPSDIVVVDDTYVQPVDGNTYVTDAFIENMLEMGASTTIQSDGQAIIFNISGTSTNGDLGINPDESGGDINAGLTVDTAGDGTFVDLGNDLFQWSGGLNIFSETDTLLNSATILTGGGLFVTSGGDITADGATLNTRADVGTQGDGQSIYLTAANNIIIDNSDIFFDVDLGAGATLSLLAINGDVRITDSLLESDYTIPDPMFPNDRSYFSDVIISAGGDVILTETDVFGLLIDINAVSNFEQIITNDSVIEATQDFIGTAGSFDALSISAGENLNITAEFITLDGGVFFADSTTLDASTPGGTVSVVDATLNSTSQLNISADQGIDGNPQSLSGLSSARINLNSGSGGVDVAIDSSSGETELTVQSSGNVEINDIAGAGSAQGLKLVRVAGPGSASVQSTNGDVRITTPGQVALGSGNGSTIGDAGVALVSANGSVTLSADSILDRNSTTSASGGTEIVAGGPIVLEGLNGIGSFDTNAEINVQTNNLTAIAEGPSAPINVASNEDLEFIDLRFNGGRVNVADNLGGVIRHEQVGGSGPNVLRLDQRVSAFDADAIFRVTSLADILVHDFNILANQKAVIATNNGASVLNGDTGNTGTPNISHQAGGTDGFIAINSDGDIGSETSFLSIESERVFADADGTDSNIFLDLRSPSTNPINLQGIVTDDPMEVNIVTDPLDTTDFESPGTGISLQNGDVMLNVSGDLILPGGITTGGNVAIDSGTTGDVDVANSVIDANSVVVQAGSLSNAFQIFAVDLGLSLEDGLGAEGALQGISSVQNLAFGSDNTASYYILANTEIGDDVTIVESVSVRNQSVSGNDVANLVLQNRTGDIIVDAPVDAADTVVLRAPDDSPDPANIIVNEEVSAGSRIQLDAFQDIRQGTNGLLDTTNVVLSAGGDIGSFTTGDLLTSASTLAANAGGSAYIRNAGPELTIQSDADVPAVGATDDFRVINNQNDLIVSTNINATNIGLATGTNTEIGAQTLGGDIILNNNVIASGNLVLLAGGNGNIVRNSGILQANQMGLGSNGTVGTPGNGIILLNTNELALFAFTSQLNTDPAPTPVAQVSSVGLTVNQGTANPPPPPPPPDPDPDPDPEPNPNPPTPEVPDGSIVVEVVLEPTGSEQFEEIVDGTVFAQNNVGLVDDYVLELLNEDSYWNGIFDPTYVPSGWWDDDDFLRRKFRHRSTK